MVAAIEGHRGDVPHAFDLAPELSPAGGERFDPATGELPAVESAADRMLACSIRLSAALQAIGQEVTDETPALPVPEPVAVRQAEPLELARKDLQLEITLDYDMDM